MVFIRMNWRRNKPFALIFIELIFLQLFQLHSGEVQQDGMCFVVSMLPFSSDLPTGGGGGDQRPPPLNRWTPEILSRTGFSYLAATLLAMDHFNSRDPSVVPELASLGGGDECNVFFPTPKVVDTLMDGSSAVREVWQATPGSLQLPCAIVGPALLEPAMSIQSITGAINIPQLVYSFETDVLFRDGVRNTVGTANSDSGRSHVMVEYLKTIPTDSLAILYEFAPETSGLATDLRDYTGPDNGIFVNAFLDAKPPRGVTLEEHQLDLVRQIKDSGIKTIFINTGRPESLPGYAQRLLDAGMFSHEYVYILAPHLVPTDSLAQMYGPLEPGSPLYQLLSGALVFDTMDLFRVNPDNDSFLTAWRNVNSTFIDRVNALNPVLPNNTAYYQQVDTDFFQKKIPANFASFVYDAVMLVGMGACQEKSANSNHGANNDRPPPPSDGTNNIFSGNQSSSGAQGGGPPPDQKPPSLRHLIDSKNERGHQRDLQQGPPPVRLDPDVQGMVGSTFHGASGPVSFRRGERSRNHENVTMGLYNIRPSEIVLDSMNGTRTFEAVLTSLWTKDKGWENIEGTSIIYRDGTSNRPNTNRVVDNNYLSSWVRGLGLALFFSASLLGLGSMMAVWILRNDAAVRRSQPIFMHLLCFGSVIVSLTILSLSFDEGSGWTDQQLDVACTMTPWFFFLGQIMMFAALFTKLWRTDKVLQFRRRAVTVKSVMGPLVVMLFITLVILTTWTIVDPWTWERTWISEVPPETYGKCTSDHFWAYFGPLMGLLIVAEGATAFYAWKTSDVPEDFSDTGSVIQAICTQLQAWVVGVPILAVVRNSSAEATYLGRVLLIWIFAVSSVGVVVGPKIYRAIMMRRNPQLQNTKCRVSISGVHSSSKNSLIRQQTCLSTQSTSEQFGQPVRRSSIQVSFCEPPQKLSLMEDGPEQSLQTSNFSEAEPSSVIFSPERCDM